MKFYVKYQETSIYLVDAKNSEEAIDKTDEGEGCLYRYKTRKFTLPKHVIKDSQDNNGS